MGLQAYDGTQWASIGGGAETYSVYASDTSAVTVTKAATVSIPTGTYIVSQLSTVATNNSSFDSYTITGTENEPVKFTGSVTSVSVTLKPDIVLASSYNTWTTRTSTFGTTNIFALTFGNNTYIAAGASGQLRTSTDSITWTTRTSNATTILRALTFGNNTYVAAGDSGQIRTSTDGITWTTRTSNLNDLIRALAFGNNTFVAAGDAGRLNSSTDGITWTTRTSNFSATSNILSLTFGNGLFVAGGGGGGLSTSTDGITWTARTSGITNNILSLHYFNNLYFYGSPGAVIGTSTDGITWTTRSVSSVMPNDITSFTSSENFLLMANESGSIALSPDGLTFTTRTSGFGSSTINSSIFSNGVFVIAGNAGKISTSNDTTVNPSTIATVFTKLDAVEAS